VECNQVVVGVARDVVGSQDEVAALVVEKEDLEQSF